MRLPRYINLYFLYVETDVFRWRKRERRNARARELTETRFEHQEHVEWRREGFTLIGQVFSTYRDRRLGE